MTTEQLTTAKARVYDISKQINDLQIELERLNNEIGAAQIVPATPESTE